MARRMNAAIVLSFAALAMPVAAEAIYRCGDSYSQKPCPGGRVVDTEDARSAAQRSQTAQAVQRDAKVADAMEKARLKEEAKPAQAYIPAAKPADGPQAAGKTKKPVEFKAMAPAKAGEATTGKKKKQAKKPA